MSDLDLLIDAAHAAGEIACRFHGDTFQVSHKSDNSPVSEADHAVNDMLCTQLRAARPDYGWLSEESTDDPARLETSRTFVVDPIDGTRSFVDGHNTWAHALAVVENGQPVAAVVYLPLRDKLYTATRGGGAALNGVPIRPSATKHLPNAQVLTTKPNLAAQHWRGDVPAFHRGHRPSLAYRMCLVAEGRYDAMFTFRAAWEWDIVAGTLIGQEAGAIVTDRTGAALTFNAPHPQSNSVVSAGPPLHADILSRL